MKLLLTRRFQKSYEKLGKRIQFRIKAALKEIRDNPYQGKKLSGDLEGEYSWRVGRYRILYSIQGKNIWLETVRHRKEVYRRR